MIILVIFLIALALFAYLNITSAPKVNLIVSLDDEVKILELKEILKANGIECYTKYMKSEGIVGGHELRRVEFPSLHVVNAEELMIAKKLVAANLEAK